MGAAPPALERAARTCTVGDAMHRGLVVFAAQVARNVLAACAPPGSVATVFAALDIADRWATGTAPSDAVSKARSDAFTAASEVEQRTSDSVEHALAALPRKRATKLDAHADHVAVRHARLGATYACGTALLALDTVASAAQGALVVQQAAGALAYRATGLGAARSSELRDSAWSAAEWEAERLGRPGADTVRTLAIQLFHEYLGGRWKDHSDAHRIRFSEVAAWALEGAS